MKENFPDQINGLSAWKSVELAGDNGWIYNLDDNEKIEIETAVELIRKRKLKIYEFGIDDFPLKKFAVRLDAILDQVENGRGCALLRGLDIASYDEDTLKLIYWGLGVHIGTPISQNAQGQLIGHVRDRGGNYYSHNVRGYTTNSRIRPHCDPADTVALLCVQPAKKGGESEISSSTSIYNELLKKNPELLEPLFNGFHFDLRGEGVTDNPDEVTFNQVPVFSYFDSKMSCRFNAKSIIEGQVKIGRPLEGVALKAVETVADLASQDEFRYDMTFCEGDIQILNNHTILHARGDFEDHKELERKRNLLRLWTNLRNGRQLASDFADRLNTGPRGGVMIRKH